MTLRHLRIFAAVCEEESVTLAAEQLHLSQPAVSLAVKELEAYYGVALFDRISRKLYLTQDGRQFLHYARQILALFDEMEKGIRDWDSFGILRVGSSLTIGTVLIPGYVKAFTSQYPKLDLRVLIDNSTVIIGKIQANELDFGLIEGVAHSDAITSEPFLEDELVLVCGACHPLAGREEISLEEFAAQTLILREQGSGTRDLLDSTLLTHGITASPAWVSVNTESIINAVSAGLGVSVLPQNLVRRSLEEGRLKLVRIRGITFLRHFNIIYHKDKHLSRSALDFIRMCRETGRYFPEQGENSLS